MMPRREFLPMLGLSALSAKPRLKITEIRLRQLKLVKKAGTLEPAWNPGGTMPFQVGGGSIVEVMTDQGLVGIGPSVPLDLIGAIKVQLLGKDPFDIEQLAPRLRYYASGPSYRGASGVDIALWDLIGKASNQPLYKLWGAAKEKVIPYASMIRLSTPEERAELASRLASEGWRAIKLRLHYATMREDLRVVEAVKKAVGDRMEIMVDANQAQSSGSWQPGILWDLRRAVETARELQKLGCVWLEEPLPRFAFNKLSELNRLVELPIAGGEHIRGAHEFQWMLRDGVYDVLQPESMVLEGGVTELRKIAVMAEAYGKQIVPHHGGRELGTIAHLHLVASWRHAPYVELLHDPPIGDYRHAFSVLENPPLVDGEGMIAPPQEAGLGVQIKRDLISEER